MSADLDPLQCLSGDDFALFVEAWVDDVLLFARSGYWARFVPRRLSRENGFLFAPGLYAIAA